MESRSGFNILEGGDIPSLVQSDIPTAEELASVVIRVVDEVEITPPKMVFNDAYEGKEFVKKITILNKGKRTASIRICCPSAKSFIIRPILKMRRLPPGLSITRTLRFKYSRAYSIHDATIPIFINNELIEYSLTVFLNQPRIVVEPSEVNFGNIDAVSSVVTKTVVVKNEGTKNCSYSIDLGRNELELIVEPVKGVLQAWESVTLRLEMMGFYEGPFEKEFWIKTAPPKRVKVVGEFITPKIIPTYPKAYSDFSMVNFPRIYVGQHATRTLMVKNISSTSIMFCVMGVGEDGLFTPIEEAKKSNQNFCNFHVTPLEGRLASQQTTVVEIAFRPRPNDDDYALCFLQVIRVHYSDITDPALLQEKSTTEVYSKPDRARSSLMALATSLRNEQNSSYEEMNNDTDMVTEERISQFDSFRVCLYGDLEVAGVKLRPSSIHLNDITIKEVYYREIAVENDSNYLPITVTYVKCAFVNVKPKSFFLKPKETREILLIVKPNAGGTQGVYANFNLTANENEDYYDKPNVVVIGTARIRVEYAVSFKKAEIRPKLVRGLTPNITNEVGLNADQLCFGSDNVNHLKTVTLKKNPKFSSEYYGALMALPNDRPRSLRPWTNKQPCLTVFAKIPRVVTTHDEYGLSPSKDLLKTKNTNYYTNYMRKQQEIAIIKSQRKFSIPKSFELSRKELFKKFSCDIREVKGEFEEVVFNEFFPLSPFQLYNVKLSSKYIRLQRVAPVSNVENQFTITNNNDFPIFIYLTAIKPGIRFPQGHYKIVKPFEEKTILLTCFAGLVGRYINVVQVIINFSHIHTISIMVQVVPKVINLGLDSITMEPDEPAVKYLELMNNLNSSITFSWDVSYSRFRIFPTRGVILPKHAIICAVEYESVPDMPDYSEMVLTSEGGGSQLVQISKKKQSPTVEIVPSNLQLPVLPTNTETCHRILIRNLMSCDISFVITDPMPLDGINVEPAEGTICGVGCIILQVWIKIESFGPFKAKLEILFEDAYNKYIKIEGSVLAPSIEIKPETIVNRQMIPFAYKRNVFYIKNVSNVDCWVKFKMDDYEWFNINDDENGYDTSMHNENIKLIPGEVKRLYMHFSPKESVTDSFYLPIVMNDILGPPMISNAESMRSVFMRTTSDGLNLAAKLPLLKITSIVGNASLRFSALSIGFMWTDSVRHENVANKLFSVQNVGQKDAVEFCVRIETIPEEFEIIYGGGAVVIESPYSMRCKLEPCEIVHFNVSFKPLAYGRYNADLPIFVRNYLEGTVYNYLRLRGNYQQPLILAKEKHYFLEPVPVCFKNIFNVTLIMKHHKPSCYVSFEPPNLEVSVSFKDDRNGSRRSIIRSKITIIMHKTGALNTTLKFFCTCDGSCTITLRSCADDTFLTHHAFIQMNRAFFLENLVEPVKIFQTPSSEELVNETIGDFDILTKIKMSSSLNYVARHVDNSDFPESWNQYSFPSFPSPIYEPHEYTVHMTETLRCLEKWVSSQCFYQTLFLKIPEIMAMVPVGSLSHVRKAMKKGPDVPEPFFLKILVNLVGSSVKDVCITSKPSTSKYMDIALHFFTTYQNIIKFLTKEGLLIPHVLPEFLLNFEQYQIMCTFLPQELNIEERFDKDAFNALSTQCYMDLILQTIRVYILNNLKVFEPGNQIEHSFSKHFLSEGEKTYSEYSIDSTGEAINIFKPNVYVYSDREHMLLYWLYYHYESEKHGIWGKEYIGDEIHDLKNKQLKTFDDDLEDSLVFSAVTVAYCPYLKDFVKDMYVSCSTIEEYHHNACKLISAWQLLQLSYKIEPMDIVKPNPINVLLLTMYLYEVLPSFYPKEELNMEAKLTQTSVATITIQNPAEHNILYGVYFFNNESKCFSSEQQLFKIPAKKSGSLKITYRARKIASQRAILLLSGELPGQKYTKTRVINLNGITDINNPTYQETFKVDCYKIQYLSVNLHSPYEVPDQYEIFYKISEPKQPKDLQHENLHSWREYVEAKVPKRMYTKSPSLSITDPNEGCKFEPIVCSTIVAARVYTMFLVGKYGDWSFEITISPKITKLNHEAINVSLSRGFHQQMCTCKDKTQTDVSLICPRTIRISIPCKNNLFYKAMREMFIACTHEQYFAFWKKYLPIRTVFNILKLLFLADKSADNLLDYQEMFKKCQTYNVYTEPNSPCQAVRQLMIEDVSSEKTADLLIHAGPEFESRTETLFIEMEAVTGMEIRYYKLNFYES